MAIEVFKRTEKKYMLTDEVYRKLLAGMEGHMVSDEFSADGKFYNIANIYYDTPTDELIRASIEKPVYKEKLRLRSYGVPGMEDKVFLEIKKKYKGVVYKRRTKMKLREAYDLINKGIMPQKSEYINWQVLTEIQYFLKCYDLGPSVYISYDRRAYFGADDSEFRVTFDRNIRTRREDVALEKGNHGIQLLPEGLWLMEVKTPTAVPMWFTDLLTENEVFSNSFSKYGTEYKQRVNEVLTEGEEETCLSQFSVNQPARPYPLRRPYLAY